MLKIGITGGIGSGKTTVAKVFETLGIPVYYADDAAKQLMNTDEALKQKIKEQFGEESYENGLLNRKYIASIVFNNPDKLAILNSLTHPATIAAANEWIGKQTSPYILKEAALLFESGSDKGLDYIIGVSAPYALRLQRVMQRDNTAAEEVEKRMARQLDEEKKMKRCNFIIVNDESQAVIPQVLVLDKQFREMVKNR
jgi:dephospho-CoA kinase